MALIAIGGSMLALRHPESKPLEDEQREAEELLEEVE
jgi:hypothetical protein